MKYRSAFILSAIWLGINSLLLATEKTNILFILCDDLGWNDVGYNGASYQLTPNIDKLSEQSLVLHRSYARPTCAPSRASLFTGYNSAHTKIYHVKQFYGVQPTQFKVSPPTSGHHYTEPIAMLSDTLKSAGYTTGYVGKWHVTKDPTQNGFDFNAGGWKKGGPASYFSPYKNPMLADGPEGEYLPERMADESIGFIKRNKDKPFFLCYAPYSVHYPVQARPEDISFFEKRTKDHEQQLPIYAAMVYALDQAIGRVLDTLKSEGLLEKTLIVFTSDNGHNGRGVPAIKFRGSKGTVYEGGTRVPTLVSWQGKIQPGSSSELVDIIDWYPTLIDIAGAQQPEHKLDGVSLRPLLQGQSEKTRDALFMHVPAYNGSEGRKNIIDPFFQTPCTVVWRGNYKYIRNYEPQRQDELYDLSTDPGEQNNLINDRPELVSEMSKKMDLWIKNNGAELPMPLDK